MFHSLSLRFISLVGGVLALLSAAGVARAQDGATEQDLTRAYYSVENRWRDLIRAKEQPGKADVKVATIMANYYVRRIPLHTDPDKLARLHRDFDSAINREALGSTHTKNRRFIDEMFGPALVKSVHEVIAGNDVKEQPRTVINASMMLPVMARLKQDKVTEYLLKLVDEKGTHDAVRLYALRGLAEVMPIRQQYSTDPLAPLFEDFENAAQNAKRAKDTKLVDALVMYIETPRDWKGKSPGEVEAMRYLRKEAIMALAKAESPAVTAVAKPPRAAGFVAPTLLKVMAGTLEPPPSLQEKIEAALGICAMKYKHMPEYDPQVGVYWVGRTLLEFTITYNTDYSNFTNVGAQRRLPFLPWKGDAARLKAGVPQLGSTALSATSAPILDRISKWQSVSNPQIQDLTVNVQKALRPKAGNVFKTLKAPVIPLN